MAHGTPHRLPPPAALADDAVRVVVAAASAAPVRAALERAGLSVVAEADSLRDAVPATVRDRARACVLDAALPGDRDWAIRAIRSALPDTVVVLFSAEASD